jgi:hypothetical protein
MRKIHITEAQFKRLTETYNQGAGVKVAAKTDNNGKVTQTSLEQQNHELDTQGLNKAQIVVDQDTLAENKYDMFTKKQLKEARLAKLMAESKKYKKSEL